MTDQSVKAPCGNCGMEWPYSDCPAGCGHPVEIERLEARVEELERQLAEAKKPPPCQHTQRHGRVQGAQSEWWCAQCGKPMPAGYISIYGGMGFPKWPL